jgi:hypothetical protein
MCIYCQDPAGEASAEQGTEGTLSETRSEESADHSVLAAILSVFTPE